MEDADDGLDLDRWIDGQLATAELELFDQPAEDVEHDGYLAVGVEPRDCRNAAGIRPCPFVGCPHHLLLTVIPTDRAEPNLALSRARLPMFVAPGEGPALGRRRELAPTVPLGSGEDLAFQRRAVERLWEMPDTCSREVALRGGLDVRAVARALGAEEDEVGLDLDDAVCALRGAAIVAGADPEDGESMRDAVFDVLGIPTE
jgi:hypothetical protein